MPRSLGSSRRRRIEGMTKTDLYTFMSGSGDAAISGDAAKAAAFWDGLRLLQSYFAPSEFAEFICSSIASRLKKNQGTNIATVVERLCSKRLGAKRLGAKRTMAVLTRPLLLRVLPEFVKYISTIDDAALWSEIKTPKSRKLLLERLKAAKGTE